MDQSLYTTLRSPTTLLGFCIVLFAAILIIIRHALLRRGCSLKLWRCFCFVPLAACIVYAIVYYHATLYVFRASVPFGMALFGLMYLAAVAVALLAICPKRAWLRRIVSGLTLLFCAAAFLTVSSMHPIVLGQMLHNCSYGSWEDSFVQTVRCMQKEYVLSEWKSIDYDALIEKYVPQIRAAEAADDRAALGAALWNYCEEFSDGHVSLKGCRGDIMLSVEENLIGSDHGLSLLPRDDGKIVAVDVEPGSAAEAAGIRLGTVITSWNGVPVDEARAALEIPLRPPVEENEEPSRTILLAGTGGDVVSVGFIADDGSEKSAELPENGNYSERFHRVEDAFLHSDDEPNFSYRMLDEHCGYLYIGSEGDDIISTVKCVVTGRYDFVTQRVDNILQELQAEGMTRLVLDIRNNTGGLPEYDCAIASLFYSEQYLAERDYYRKLPDWRGQDFTDYIVQANGKWAELPVVVLVNQMTVSSGDLLALLMGRLPNVTLMGMTPSNCSCQTTGGCIIMCGGWFRIDYPTICADGPDGLPLIDTDASRVSRIGLEHRIPLDAAAIEAIFGGDPYDYELDYAVCYLTENAP